MMSAAAVANGGGIAAGGVVATLQAAGELNIWNKQFYNKSDLFKWLIGYTNSFNFQQYFMSLGAAGIPLAGQAIVGTMGAALGAIASMARNSTV